MDSFNSKVLVFGEYSVLYDSMALTMPYDRFSGRLCYPNNKEESAIAVLSNKGIRKFCDHILKYHTDDSFQLNVNKLAKELDTGLFFKSNIPQGFGLGSSGALVAAVFLRYLNKAGEFKDELKNLTMDRIQNLKKCLSELENHFHGKSSGMDPLSILINEPILLKTNKEVVKVNIPTYNRNGKNVLFLLNTGLARNSEKLIQQFNKSCEQADFKQRLHSQLIKYTNDVIQDFLNANTEKFYDNLENLVRFQFLEMDYLIPKKHQNLVVKGLEQKDYFLKICGSGGGGYMIGFTQNWDRTQQILKKEELEVFYRY